MQALLYADQTRHFLDEQNAARAAYAAMQAGAFGGDLLSDAERVRPRRSVSPTGVRAARASWHGPAHDALEAVSR